MKLYNKPLLFYTLSTAIPWSFWSVAAYISHLETQNELNALIASIIGFIGLISPMIVAFWLMKRDKILKKDLFPRFFNFKSIKLIYLFLTAFLMLGSILLSQAISLLFGYSASQFQIAGHYTFTSGVFPVWFLLIIAPIVEELAWHTYGTDTLRQRYNLFKTSMVFALFWGVWHIPLSFIKDYYQSNLVESGTIYSINFIVSLFPFVLIMNWLYYKSNRNILIPIIFHISAGYFNEIFATHPMSKVIQTGLLILLSIYFILKDKAFYFNLKTNH